MRFTIIVPVYNIEDKISKCLESIIAQTYKDYEVLVVNDGSTDQSEEICRAFEKRDSRIRVISKENGGLVSARKCGAELATGEYIINIDGDDYVESNYLLKANGIIDDFYPDMIAFGYRELSSETQERVNVTLDGLYKDEKLLKIKESIVYDQSQKGFKGGSLINTVWTKIAKKKIYQKCQSLIPNHISVGEDLLLNVYLIDEIGSLYVSNESFYDYVVYASSMMHKYNLDNFRHYLDVSEELKKIHHIEDNDINVYLFQGFISEIRKVAKCSTNYRIFKETIEKCEEVVQMLQFAKKAKIRNFDFEFFVKYVLVSMSNWSLLYFVCKYS